MHPGLRRLPRIHRSQNGHPAYQRSYFHLFTRAARNYSSEANLLPGCELELQTSRGSNVLQYSLTVMVRMLVAPWRPRVGPYFGRHPPESRQHRSGATVSTAAPGVGEGSRRPVHGHGHSPLTAEVTLLEGLRRLQRCSFHWTRGPPDGPFSSGPSLLPT